MQDELRDMTIELRLIKAAGSIDGEMMWNEKSLGAYLPPARFYSGILTYEHNFVERGKYVALIRAKDKNGSKEYNASFEFTVGETSIRELIATSFLSISALGGFWL